MVRTSDALGQRFAGFATFEAQREDHDLTQFVLQQRGRTGVWPAKLIRSIRPDALDAAVTQSGANAIVIQYASTASLLARAIDRVDATVPILVQCHGIDVSFRKYSIGVPYKNYGQGTRYKAGLARLARRVKFIANSEKTQGHLREAGVPADRIVVNYLGVDETDAVPRSGVGSPLRILQLGRLVDCKGPFETLSAFERLCDDGIDAELVFVGGGGLEASLRSRVDESRFGDRVEVLGALPNDRAMDEVEKSDVLTLHSKVDRRTGQVEAFGVVIVEAMAHGVPTVAARLGGPAEIIRDGETGLLFETGDDVGHARALRSVVEDDALYASMSAAALLDSRERFSVASEVEGLLTQVEAEQTARSLIAETTR